MSARLCAVSGVSALLLACGGSQAPAESPANGAEGDSGAKEKGEETTSLPPLKPVNAPDGIVGRFRVSNPAALADGVFEALSIPFNWRMLYEQEDELKKYAAAIHLEGPIEGAAGLNPRSLEAPLHFISFGATGVEQVLSVLDKEGIPSSEAPGNVYRFQLEEAPCLVGRSLGASPARVVCSENIKSLLAMQDYALRGLPNEKLSDAVVHFEADFRPIYQRYGKELKRARLFASVMARQAHIGNAKFDQALTDAAIGIAEESVALLDDLETVTAQLFEKEGRFDARFKMRFEGETSASVQALLELERAQGEVPEIFAALPGDSISASYSRQLSHETTGAWFSILADLVAGMAESEGASPQLSSHLSSLVKLLGPSGGTMISARGPMSVYSEDNKKRLDSGWAVLATTNKKNELVKLLEEVSWLLASKEVKEKLDGVEELPQLKKVNTKIPGAPGASVYRWSLPASYREEASALSLPSEYSSYRHMPGIIDSLGDFTQGLVAVHEMNGATYVAWGLGDGRKEVGAAFEAVREVKGPTLSSVKEVAVVNQSKAAAAGFSKVGGLIAPYAWLIPREQGSQWESMLRATPNQGQVPMTYSWSIKKGKVIEADMKLELPVEFSQDAATIVALVIAELASMR